jgi:hypothetical protein
MKDDLVFEGVLLQYVNRMPTKQNRPNSTTATCNESVRLEYQSTMKLPPIFRRPPPAASAS